MRGEHRQHDDQRERQRPRSGMNVGDAGIRHQRRGQRDNERIDERPAIDFLDKTGEYSGVHFPDLVFLDINIPKKNGHEVLEYIKTNEALKHITVIMLSTSSTQADKDKAYKNLANGFITKPLAIDDVMRAVSEIQHATILYS